ncbi:MAG: hypothetical protein ACQETE_01690 [Bacteroidota bacterium]
MSDRKYHIEHEGYGTFRELFLRLMPDRPEEVSGELENVIQAEYRRIKLSAESAQTVADFTTSRRPKVIVKDNRHG